MSLRKLCREIILKDVIQALKQEHEWKVLVLDDVALKIVSSCCTTEEILKENIAIIELAEKPRSALKQFEAIYILEATSESVDLLYNDFMPNKYLYDGAHIFFLSVLSNDIFRRMCERPLVTYIKTVQEINISFLPVESQVFALGDSEALTFFYGSDPHVVPGYCEYLAEGIATLCCTLEECPVIRYSRRWSRNMVMAEKVCERLQVYYKNFSQLMAVGAAQLLILDRGFDLISPLIHDLTLQATAYDILDINDNIYEYRSRVAQENKNVNLDETAAFWVEHRHEHLARLPQIMQDIMKKLEDPPVQPDDTVGRDANIQRLTKDVAALVRLRMKKPYAGFRHMIAECLECYSTRLKPLCDLEQDMAMRQTTDGNFVVDPIEETTKLLSSEIFTKVEKLRIIMLYVLFMGGIAENLLIQLISVAKLKHECILVVKAMSKLGYEVITETPEFVDPFVPRKNRSNVVTYRASRWTPVLKDVLEYLLDNELDEHDFPFFSKESGRFSQKRKPVWRREETSENRTRLIVFIVGGVTYSEMRCAYEITKENPAWEVIVGSDHIITPELFIKDLRRAQD